MDAQPPFEWRCDVSKVDCVGCFLFDNRTNHVVVESMSFNRRCPICSSGEVVRDDIHERMFFAYTSNPALTSKARRMVLVIDNYRIEVLLWNIRNMKTPIGANLIVVVADAFDWKLQGSVILKHFDLIKEKFDHFDIFCQVPRQTAIDIRYCARAALYVPSYMVQPMLSFRQYEQPIKQQQQPPPPQPPPPPRVEREVNPPPIFNNNNNDMDEDFIPLLTLPVPLQTVKPQKPDFSMFDWKRKHDISNGPSPWILRWLRHQPFIYTRTTTTTKHN